MDKQLCEDVHCPSCGQSMYRIDGKFGIFYGCSQFPQCKGKRTEYDVRTEFENYDDGDACGIAGLAAWEDQF